MHAAKVAALSLTILLVVLPAGFAQKDKNKDSSTRSVSGMVTGADDKPVVGAVVQLKDTKTKNVRSFYTQDKGEYYFHELSPDVDYELTATYQGAASKTRTLSVFDSRKDAVINLKLNPKK
ncbi:MAG TPA: carboxypeptidase-like regulatory domain-containing protein [Bryobacteraceae bacterium]|nr:carboxypeptidase-like regulatory domain-containing protein [Bryobacteraceae bacterium]